MHDWRTELDRGALDSAWDRFIEEYRGLLFAAIRHYVRDHDDVMDAFAHVCEELREDNFRRLRAYHDDGPKKARFTTWLVTIVQRLTVDWLRSRHGRKRPSTLLASLPPLRRRIVELVFERRCPHLEAFGRICAENPPGPTYNQFLAELREAYQAVDQHGHLWTGMIPYRPDEAVEPKEGSVEREEQVQWLEQALAILKPEDRIAVELFVVQNLAAADVARILGLPNAKSAYNRVYRALDAIRAWLAAAGIGGHDL